MFRRLDDENTFMTNLVVVVSPIFCEISAAIKSVGLVTPLTSNLELLTSLTLNIINT